MGLNCPVGVVNVAEVTMSGLFTLRSTSAVEDMVNTDERSSPIVGHMAQAHLSATAMVDKVNFENYFNIKSYHN